MTWRLMSDPRTLAATPALAREFDRMTPLPKERPLSEKRLEVYRAIWADNNFRTVTWASCLCRADNGLYRVNGMHTSRMLVTTDPWPHPFRVTVERYEADTLQDVAALYGTFDSRLGTRTANDINVSFASAIPALADLSARTVSLAVSAIALNTWSETELRKVPHPNRVAKLVEHTDFVGWLDEIIPSSGAALRRFQAGEMGSVLPLRRVPVAAAMYATFHQAGRRHATDFWKAVRDGSESPQTVPSRVLQRYLQTAVISGGKGAASNSRQVATGPEVRHKCHLAFNAWMTGSPTNLRYQAGSPLPALVRRRTAAATAE